MSHKKYYFFSIYLAIFFSTLINLTSCSGKQKNISPPIDVPFSIDKGNEEITFFVDIKKPDIYTFGLSFYENNGDPEDAGKLIKMMGSSGKNTDEEYSDLGVPLDIYLHVVSEGKNKKILFGEIVREIPIYSWGDFVRNKIITNIKLDPGRYRITVKNNRQCVEFKDRRTEFHIREAYLGK